MRSASLSAYGCLCAFIWVAAIIPVAAGQEEKSAGFGPSQPIVVLEEPDEPSGYRATISEAVREYNAHNFAESHALFAKAHAAYPNARTLRGLGMVEFELKRYRECIEHLQQALDSEVKSLDEVLRRRAEELLSRARNFVASVHIEVEPAAAQVVIDGEPASSANAADLLLRVGDHVLEFRAPGHFAERRELQLSGGELKQLRVVLTRQVDFTQQPAIRPEPPERKRLFKNVWLWSGVAAVVTGSAVALSLALRDHSPTYDGGSTNTVVRP